MTHSTFDTPTAALTTGQLVSLNVGQIRTIEWLGEIAMTAIWKAPVSGQLPVRGINIVGDDQADRQVHGGRDKAIYAYAREDEDWWAKELGRPIELGTFGENLTVAELDVTGAVVGEHWRIGTALLEVAQPRIPCWKLGARMNDPKFPSHFSRAGRPGAYLRILTEGEVGAGDSVSVIRRPAHGLTVGDVARIYHRDHDEAERMLTAPELAHNWVEWATNVLAHRRGKEENR